MPAALRPGKPPARAGAVLTTKRIVVRVPARTADILLTGETAPVGALDDKLKKAYVDLNGLVDRLRPTQNGKAESFGKGVTIARIRKRVHARRLPVKLDRATWFTSVERGEAASAEVISFVLQGLNARTASRFVKSFRLISPAEVLDAIGTSQRTLERTVAAKASLGIDASDRATRLAEARALANRVFGSADKAESWLTQPAMGLNGERPITLLKTAAGANMVNTFLERIEFGVYT